MKRDASCRSSANWKSVRLPENFRPRGAINITPPLNGIVTSLSPFLIPAISLVFLSSTSLYFLSNATAPKIDLIVAPFVPHIKAISHSDDWGIGGISQHNRKRFAPGGDLNPRRPEDKHPSRVAPYAADIRSYLGNSAEEP